MMKWYTVLLSLNEIYQIYPYKIGFTFQWEEHGICMNNINKHWVSVLQWSCAGFKVHRIFPLGLLEMNGNDPFMKPSGVTNSWECWWIIITSKKGMYESMNCECSENNHSGYLGTTIILSFLSLIIIKIIIYNHL